MSRNFAVFLGLGLLFSVSSASAQTNTDPNRGVARVKPQNEGGTASNTLPQFSGNLPSTINEDRTHGINAPGTMIGPAPENDQPDPRFANGPSSSGGGSEINDQSPSSGAAQTATGATKMSGAGQNGGTSSNLNEALPSASMDNSGANSGGASGGTGGGAGGSEANAGGDARPGVGASQSRNGSSDVGRETRGAAPYPLIALGVILVAFVYSVVRKRGRR